MRALLLAIGVALVTVSCGQASSPTARQMPSPSAPVSPTALTSPIQVPGSTPVILYHDRANFDQLDGVTWEGTSSGKVGLGVNQGGSGNPQGTLYSTVTDLRDRAGTVVDSTVANPVFWADDGVRYCNIVRTKSRDVTGPGMLQIGVPGQASRNVVQVGTFGAAGLMAGGPAVIACSPAADRAVAYQSGGQGVGVVDFWVIQLSSGRTLWSGGGGGAWIAASHDGRYVALSPAPGFPTTIYGQDGSVAGTTPDEVFAFSWDETLAVVAGSFGSTPSIVDWRTSHTIWSCPNNQFKYWQAFPEPGGSHMAVGVLDPAYPQTGGFAPVDLFVVGADGAVVFERNNLTLFQD
jgi:hypothetical protein